MTGIITQRGILVTWGNQENFTVNKFLENLVREQKKQLVVEKEINQQQKRQLALNKCRLDSLLLGITDIVLTVATEQNSRSVVSENLGNLDLSRHHLIQQTIAQFWQPETSQTFFAQVQQAIEHQQRIDFEYSISVPDQEQFWFSAQISPLPDNTAIWVARDITKSKPVEIETKLEVEDITQPQLAELALQESEARFISLLNTCPFLVWTLGTNRLCNFVNTAWLDFTGRSLEQELDDGWTVGVHPEDLDSCLSIYNTAFTRLERFEMEYRFRKRNGEYAWVYNEGIPRFKADGSFTGYIGTCIDISDRIKSKQEREELLQQVDQERQFLKTVLQQMPAGVMIGEPPLGNIILSNDRVESIFRHSLKPITSLEDYRQFSCLQDDGKPISLEDYCMLRACRGEVHSNQEFKYLCGDGVIRTLLVNAAPVRNHQQKIIAGVITLYDVTEQKQALAAKKEAENKSILLKEIHHRIKNNLQIVSSLLDLQSDQIQDPSAIILLEKSQARIHTMALIHEKLYTSRNLAQIDFVEYISSLIRHLHDSFIQDFKQIKLDLDIEQIYLDLDLAIPCGLIINELVVNSLEHAFHNQVSGEIKLSFHKYAQNYQLTIQDNGSGNALEIARIEDDSRFLGLSLVNSLVKDQLKGVLKFEQNNGFVIQITLPLI